MEKEETNSKVKTLLSDAMSQIKTMSSTETIMGEPIITSFGTTIIPVTKATIGFVLGGGEYCNLDAKKFPITYPLVGGSGGGANLTPVGFLIEDEKEIKFIPAVSGMDTACKVVELMEKGVDLLQRKQK